MLVQRLIPHFAELIEWLARLVATIQPITETVVTRTSRMYKPYKKKPQITDKQSSLRGAYPVNPIPLISMI